MRERDGLTNQRARLRARCAKARQLVGRLRIYIRNFCGLTGRNACTHAQNYPTGDVDDDDVDELNSRGVGGGIERSCCYLF